jgi:hypothetical protein
MSDELTPEQIAAALERLEQEKARRAGPTPEVPVPERHIVDPSNNSIIRNDQPPASKTVRRRRRPKPQAKPPPPPVWFYTVTGRPTLNGDAGRIQEGWYIQDGDTVRLCDGAGTVTGEWRKVERDSPLWTARAMLRDKLNARSPEPNHDRLVYPRTGWR